MLNTLKRSRDTSAVEKQLRYTTEMLSALSEGIDESIYVLDPNTYEILFANQKTKELFGERIIGKKCYRVFHQQSKPCPFCTNKHIFGKNLGKSYVWKDHQNGRNKQWYRGLCKAIEWPGGRHVRYGIAIDVTAHKKMEGRLAKLNECFLGFGADPDENVNRIVALCGELMEATCTLYNRLEGEMLCTRGKWNAPSDYKRMDKAEGHICYDVIKHGGNGVFVTRNLGKTVYAKTDPNVKRYKLQTYVGRTVKFGKTPIGVLCAVYQRDFSPTEEDKKLMGMLASAIGIEEERRRAETALRESEEKLRAITASAKDAIILVDGEGSISYWNPAAERMFGYTAEDAMGKDVLDLIVPAQFRKPMKESLGQFSKTGKGRAFGGTLEVTGLRKDRTEFSVGLSLSAFKMKGEWHLIGIIRDIAEQKRMEEALQESEQRFRSIVENSHDTIVIIDNNFRIVYANDEIVPLLGRPKEEIVGHDFRKFLDQTSKALVQETYLRRQRGERVPPTYDFKILRANGEKRDVEIKATVIRDRNDRMNTVAQLLDITERKKMEEERKRFEERLKALNTYGQSLNMARGMKRIFTLTLNAMEKTLGFEYASLMMVEGRILRMVSHRGYARQFSLNLPLDGKRGLTVRAARTGKPVLIRDVHRVKAYIKGGKNIRSELAVPIKVGNKVFGVLNVESKKIAAFKETDLKQLEILASHAGIAISNLRRQQRLSALNEYGRSLNMAETPNEIYMLTLNAMEKTLGFEFANFLTVEGKRLRLAAHRGYPKKLSLNLPLDSDRGITARAARLGKPIFVPDTRRAKAYISGRPGMLSELAVPIKLGKKVLGVLNVESKRLGGFDGEDANLLEMLGSHAAPAMSNLRRQDQLRRLSERLEYLMKSSAEVMHVPDMHRRLRVIAGTIQNFGWRRVVISLRDENLEGTDLVASGLTDEEVKLLLERKAPGSVWRERLGSNFDRYKIGEFYYLPWSDPWIREQVHGVPRGTSPDAATTYAGVPSRLSLDEMVDWHPQDMLYAPLRTPEGRVVGILSVDDPLDGRKPTRNSLIPLELFLHQAAITIENAELIESLKEARKQLEAYAELLEQKVEERTRELKKSQEELLKAQRLAVIGELAGMVGHDLRNPLTSILGAQFYLKRRWSSRANAREKEMLGLIEKNITYSNKIISDLLDYSREIKLDPTETNPKTLISEALSLVQIPRNVQVVDLSQNDTRLRVDVEKMKRTFVNLIRNAVEAMPRGGTLTIKTEKQDDKMLFTVSDTGVGMSMETMEKLWTPLFTTKARGMGFGLAICKRFVEAHGGSISVESVPKKGTTMRVTVPAETRIDEGGEKIWVKTIESSLLTTTRT